LTTRIGEGSKMVITGDLKQSDRSVDNGLADLMKKLKSYGDCESLKMVEMNVSDVERSAAVSKILDIYSFVAPVTPPKVTPPKVTPPTVTPPTPKPHIFDNDAALIPKRLYKSDL